MKKNLIITLIFLSISIAFNNNLTFANPQPQAKASIQAPINTTSLNIVGAPSKYLNKRVKMQATFDKFSTLGLDYKKAMRASSDYIGILIRRDDITDHVMPLPEMKLFLKRKTAEKYIDLESGDKIAIEGTVFSTAMSDPWIEITKLTVISSKKPIKEN